MSVTKNFLYNKSLPNTWLIVKIYRSHREISYIPTFPTKLDQNPQVFMPSRGYSHTFLYRAPGYCHLSRKERAIGQEETKICRDLSKSKKVA